MKKTCLGMIFEMPSKSLFISVPLHLHAGTEGKAKKAPEKEGGIVP